MNVINNTSLMNTTTLTLDNVRPTVVLATHNLGKIKELEGPLIAYNFQVIGLDHYPNLPNIQETGKTFEENALIKAKMVSQYTDLIAVADDSGLEIDALNGAPGIYSARYANESKELHNKTNDKRNINKILFELSHIPIHERSARFCTVMVAYKPNGSYITATGFVEGQILTQPKGINGFGYDPIFFVPSLKKTFAELSIEEKKQCSHRANALRNLLELWPTL